MVKVKVYAMVGLRNPVVVGMILHLEGSVPALGYAPHGRHLSFRVLQDAGS